MSYEFYIRNARHQNSTQSDEQKKVGKISNCFSLIIITEKNVV